MPNTPNLPRLHYYLDVMGIQQWVRRDLLVESTYPAPVTIETATEHESTESSTITTTETNPLPATSIFTETVAIEIVTPPAIVPLIPYSRRANSEHIAKMDWQTLRETVVNCTECGLNSQRIQTVFGVGDLNANWLFVGEAPGADEDKQGEPFVGRAGQLLNAMLFALRLPRESVYIANILKCRPPDNRTPSNDEMNCCTPFLDRQIELLQPKIIIALGSIAARHLLNTDTPIGKLRGKRFSYRNTQIPIIATYHPAYLLRSPLEKRKTWIDLQFAVQCYQTMCS